MVFLYNLGRSVSRLSKSVFTIHLCEEFCDTLFCRGLCPGVEVLTDLFFLYLHLWLLYDRSMMVYLWLGNYYRSVVVSVTVSISMVMSWALNSQSDLDFLGLLFLLRSRCRCRCFWFNEVLVELCKSLCNNVNLGQVTDDVSLFFFWLLFSRRFYNLFFNGLYFHLLNFRLYLLTLFFFPLSLFSVSNVVPGEFESLSGGVCGILSNLFLLAYLFGELYLGEHLPLFLEDGPSFGFAPHAFLDGAYNFFALLI